MQATHEYRFLKETDFDAIIRLWQASGLSHRPFGRDSIQNITRQMQEKNTRFMGKFIEEELAVVAIVSHNGRKGWINRLAVAPRFQHMKAATMMIDYCEKWLSAQGVEIFAVLIEDDNAASMELFTKSDYVEHRDIIYYTKRLNDKV